MTIGKLSGQCDFGQKGQSYCNQRGQSCVAKRVKVAWLFQKHINVTQAEAHAHFKDIILKTPYEEIHEEIVKFVQAKSKYNLKTAKELVKNLRMSSSEFTETLRKIKGA